MRTHDLYLFKITFTLKKRDKLNVVQKISTDADGAMFKVMSYYPRDFKFCVHDVEVLHTFPGTDLDLVKLEADRARMDAEYEAIRLKGIAFDESESNRRTTVATAQDGRFAVAA